MHLYKNVLLLIIIIFSVPKGFSNPPNDWIRTGEAYAAQWDFNQAIFFFSKAIEEDPNLVPAYLHRYRAYLMINKYQEARNDLQMALVIDPEFVKNFMDRKRVEKNDSRHYAIPPPNPTH
ncbi:tetratricopeptide repeat protein [Fulvivirgaceae bacterium BMA12]|uniref:Tetratricopeptide repeat protein n=1 Tax=Agaribacillus aureus TaxID=3051825 RepID=A0ABT8L4A9_9BACT|nr:tetratricopeptide repeat protein [Fulvivirgaceae bacterium BMA12]